MKNLPLLSCKFDLDQNERKSSHVNVHASPGQTESQVFNLRLLASTFGQDFTTWIERWVGNVHT